MMLSQPPNRATMVAPIQLINPIIELDLGIDLLVNSIFYLLILFLPIYKVYFYFLNMTINGLT